MTALKVILYHTFPLKPFAPRVPFPISFAQTFKIPGKRHLDFLLIHPPLLASRLPSITTFFTHIHEILNILLSSLSTALNLPPNASLTDVHRCNAPSSDILRLLHYIPQPFSETGVPQVPHTDLGSLTLLFANSPGLQVLPSRSTKWESVVPKKHCALVNIGDGMYLSTSAYSLFLSKSLDSSSQLKTMMVIEASALMLRTLLRAHYANGRPVALLPPPRQPRSRAGYEGEV